MKISPVFFEADHRSTLGLLHQIHDLNLLGHLRLEFSLIASCKFLDDYVLPPISFLES